MALPIPAKPLFADPVLWQRAANNLIERAEGLLRDAIEWRRARPCLMAEYFRLGILEGRFVRYRRRRYSHWRRMCLAKQLTEGRQLCPGGAETADIDQQIELELGELGKGKGTSV